MSSDDFTNRVWQWLDDIDKGDPAQTARASMGIGWVVDSQAQQRARAAREELFRAGAAAIETVLVSCDAMHNAIQAIDRHLPEATSVEYNLCRLRLRVEILAAMNDTRAVEPILRALGASSALAELLAKQIGAIKKVPGSAESVAILTFRRKQADQLTTTSIAALVRVGKLALPQVEQSLSTARESARRPLLRVRNRILKPWWMFWLRM